MKKDTDMTSEQQSSSKGGKFGTILGTILCIILIPILIVNLTIIIKGYANPDKYPMFLGYAPMIVNSDSMFPEFQKGDLIIVKTVDPTRLTARDVEYDADGNTVKVNCEGDVISFFDPDSTENSVVTHRIARIEYGDQLSFITKGDANNTVDSSPVPAEKVIGVYQTKIKGAGSVALFLRTLPGFAVCVFLPLILLVVYELLRRKKYEKSKAQDTQALLAELEELRARQAEKDAKAAQEVSTSDPNH